MRRAEQAEQAEPRKGEDGGSGRLFLVPERTCSHTMTLLQASVVVAALVLVVRAGRVLTISGANFSSPNGLVQASMGGADARTRCSTEAVWVVTVPQGLGPPRSLLLTIETEVGTSNAHFVSCR